MTTPSCSISDGVYTVDFHQSGSASATAIIGTITTRLTNPTFVLSTPAVKGDPIGNNIIITNLKMTKISFDLSFTLYDGVGAFDGVTPGTTNFEKLLYLSNFVGNPKILILNGTSFIVKTDSLNIPYDAGKKDLIMNGTMSVSCCRNISMDSD